MAELMQILKNTGIDWHGSWFINKLFLDQSATVRQGSVKIKN